MDLAGQSSGRAHIAAGVAEHITADRFFLFAIYEPHTPYTRPSGLAARAATAIAFVDEIVGKLWI